MKIIELTKKLIRKLNPTPPIGGLEIGDTVLRYLLLDDKGKSMKEVTLQLSAGIIVNGRIKDRSKFVAALNQLQAQINRRVPIDVVVSISAINVYLQVFNLPAIVSGKLNEAARLNLRMISPINLNSANYDWEVLDEKVVGKGRPISLLGGFIAREIVNELSADLERAGFNIVAIEPAPLSLSRVVGKWLKSTEPHLVLNLSGDGLDLFIIRNSKLYFSYFIPWSSLKKNEINLADVKSIIVRELRRLMSFYTSKWGGLVENLVLVGMADNKEIFEHIRDKLSLNVRRAKTNSAVGAALRGLVPRSDDRFISLAKVDTEEKFFQSRVFTVIRLWRNIAITVLMVVVLVYGGFDLVTMRLSSSLLGKLAEAPELAVADDVDFKQLEAEAAVFNKLVDKGTIAEKQSVAWSSFFDGLFDLARKRSVVVKQIQLQQEDLLVVVNGRASSERNILSFKNDLSENPDFVDVSLPLTAIKTDSEGASFAVSFRLGE